MDIGEEIDKLTDGVVGRHFGQKFILVDPSEGKLIARHLDPYRVDGISRHRLDVGHHDALILMERDGVFLPLLTDGLNLYRHHLGYRHVLRLLGHHHQRIARHHEVVVLGIVMGGIERDRVELLLREVPGIRRDRPTVITRCSE